MNRRRKKENWKQLKEAVINNDTVAVERIIQEHVELGDDCDIPPWIWVKACAAALKNRCLPMVKLLLSSKSIARHFVGIETKKQLMKIAIKSDFVKGVKFLHSKGVPLYLSHSKFREKWSALVECVQNTHVEVLKYLLGLKDLDKNPDKEETLIMLCCNELNIESLKILLKSELKNTINRQTSDRQYSALHYCVRGGRWKEVLDCIQLLVEAGADVNLQDIDGTTPIQKAAECGMAAVVIYLAKRGANLDIRYNEGTLFHFLAAESNEMVDSYDEFIRLLMSQGIDINELNSCNESPLYLAVFQENEEMVKTLIKSHCDVNIKVGDDMGSVLMEPIGYSDTITQILINAGCDVNIADKYGVTPLMKCVEMGNLVLVKQLIDRGASVNAKDNNGCFVLDYLFRSHHRSTDIVKIMIEAGADIHKGNNLLSRAIDCKEYKMASLLMEHGIDVNTVDKNGDKPLALASEHCETHLVTLLISKDCDINHQNLKGETALHKALQVSRYFANYQDMEKIINMLLLQNGMNVNLSDVDGQTALSIAVGNRERSITEELLKAGADVNHCDKRRETPLVIAVKNKDNVMVDVLLKAGADVNHCDKRRETPLVIAVKNKDNVMVDVLLKADVDLKPRDELGGNAIFLATLLNASLVLDILLKYSNLRGEAESIVNATDKDGKTSLMVAADRGPKDIVEKLLRAGCNINLQDHGGKTALMFAVDNKDETRTAFMYAVDNQDETILSLLLQNGADYNICDNNDKTALMVAVQKKRDGHCEDLLKAGADVNLSDNNGNTALLIAVRLSNRKIVTDLLKAGADVNLSDDNGETALMIAARDCNRFNNRKIVTDLLKAGADVNLSDDNGETALMMAARNCNRFNNRKIVTDLLLKAGADVNLSDNNGETALMAAARNCGSSILESLLNAGADVNLSDNNGETALVAAARNWDRSILESLLNAGADVNLSDNNGKTALMAAARNWDRSILECLLNAGADVNKTDTWGRSAIHGIMVDGGYDHSWINCLKLLLINKCHASLDTPGEDGKTLFEWLLLEKREEDLIWYLFTENCSLRGLDLLQVKDKFQFPDMLMLSKILFESGAPKSEVETMILLSVLNTDLSRSTHNPMLGESEDKQQLDDFRDSCKSRSLKSRCRREIRNCIGPGISSKITQVGLPKRLQDYVVMKDLIPEKYYTLVLNDEYNGESYYFYEPDYYSDNYYYYSYGSSAKSYYEPDYYYDFSD
ncbi:serine/threonine-protein phosphatase 6 regulatory ankyrin repeat subunit C-like [Patella vulgata]|uniref:serine/threonine-protein phosphatase 6 regulatory ankyrin repeat subunit C-like n=1 Tax=Patella vulgata TaxID=6465 RepID=UPI0024A941BC|nr:serine/threonine-protein phosphatase 6 regulatory ankyrin repeat subunit C-like [Patella vulgata]